MSILIFTCLPWHFWNIWTKMMQTISQAILKSNNFFTGQQPGLLMWGCRTKDSGEFKFFCSYKPECQNHFCKQVSQHGETDLKWHNHAVFCFYCSCWCSISFLKLTLHCLRLYNFTIRNICQVLLLSPHSATHATTLNNIFLHRLSRKCASPKITWSTLR